MRGFLGNPRRVLIVVHDLVVTALAMLATLYVRFADGQNGGLEDRLPWLVVILPCYVYWYFHLYMAKWRFASLPDLRNIFRAVSVLAISLLVLDYILLYPSLFRTFFFGKVTIALYWFLQMFFLGGPRIAYRLFRLSRTQQHVKGPDAMPTLIVGRAADAEVLLRAIESGAVRNVQPVGILSPSSADQDHSVRDVPVRGLLTDLESVIVGLESQGVRVGRLVLTPSALEPGSPPAACPRSAAARRRCGWHRLTSRTCCCARA
jgi:FlaA1/EpsC-like NDP-sugar epimerase